MSSLHLSKNPFVILGTSPRARRDEINDAYQDALLDAETAEDERRLDIARQALFTPKDRVSAELSYLLGMRPNDARSALKINTPAEFESAAEGVDGTARVNLFVAAVQLASSAADARRLVDQLLAAHADIDERDVHRTVEEERLVSGFGAVSLSDISNELKTLTERHAEMALDAFTRLAIADTEILRTVEARCASNTLRQDRLARSLIARYETWVSPKLESGISEISTLLDDYVDHLSGRGAYAEIERQLLEWDKLAQPLQMADQHLGADEVHSHRLYKMVRAAVLTLANEHSRHSDALRLSELAQGVFAELPSAAAQLAADVDALVSLEQEHRAASALMPLVAAVNEAEATLSKTSATLARSGFTATAPAPVGTIRRLYGEIVENQKDPEIIAGAVRIVRSLSIELYNKQDDYKGAGLVLDYLFLLIDQLPSELAQTLRQDRKTLERTIASQRLAAALKAGRFKEAKSHCALLMESDDPVERAQYARVQKQIEDKMSSDKTSSFARWGFFGFLALIAIYNVGGKEKAAEEASYASDSGTFSDDTAEPAEAVAEPLPYPDEAAAPSDDGSETPPAPYATKPLSISELRYCLKQSKRLDAAREAVASYPQQTKFNSEVSDYNSRCGRFNYDQRDKSIIEAEIALEADRLTQEGANLVGAGPSPTFAAPSAPSYSPSAPAVPTIGEVVDAMEEDNYRGE